MFVFITLSLKWPVSCPEYPTFWICLAASLLCHHVSLSPVYDKVEIIYKSLMDSLLIFGLDCSRWCAFHVSHQKTLNGWPIITDAKLTIILLVPNPWSSSVFPLQLENNLCGIKHMFRLLLLFNYPKLSNVNNCCFLLTDSVSQDFRQAWWGCLVSVPYCLWPQLKGLQHWGWLKMAKGWDHMKASSFICLVLRPRKLKEELIWDCEQAHLHVTWDSQSMTAGFHQIWWHPSI